MRLAAARRPSSPPAARSPAGVGSRRDMMRNGLLDNLDGREHPLDDAQAQIGLEEVDVETMNSANEEDPFEAEAAPEPTADPQKLAAMAGTTSDSVRLYLR